MSAMTSVTSRRRRRVRGGMVILTAILSSSSCGDGPTNGVAEAYINAPGGLPTRVQREYLSRVTKDICDARPGSIAPETLREVTPRLLSAWTATALSQPQHHQAKGNKKKKNKKNSRQQKKNVQSGAGVVDGVKGQSTTGSPSLLEGANNIVSTSMSSAATVTSQTTSPPSPYPSEFQQANEEEDVSFPLQCALSVDKLLKKLVEEAMTSSSSDTKSVESALLTTDLYNSAITAWSRAAVSDKVYGTLAANHATDILSSMYKLCVMEGASHLRPDSTSVKECIRAWSSLVVRNNGKKRNGNKTGSSFSSPDVQGNNGNDDPSPEMKAMDLLRWMMELHKQTEFRHTIVPDRECFELVLSALSQSQSPLAGRRAEEVLLMMEEVSKEDIRGKARKKVKNLVPTTEMYNAVLTAWTKWLEYPTSTSLSGRGSGGGGNAYEDGTSEQQSITPQARAYRSEQILNHMEETGWIGEGGHQPNVISYTTVTQAYVKVHDPARATDILRRAERRYRAPAGILLKDMPDVKCHNRVLASWARTAVDYEHGSDDVTTPVEEAKSILYWMKSYAARGDTSLKPDVYSYTSLLSVYANIPMEGVGYNRRRELLREVMSLYDEMRVDGMDDRKVRPNVVTYRTLVSVINNMIPKEEQGGKKRKYREDLLRHVLRDVRKLAQDGKLSREDAKGAEQAIIRSLAPKSKPRRASV